ncbi:MAG: alpha-glucosidase [Armatimonadetes bacterium]|nr:alpha-glucosidase [Armatimonadota bacterium]
MTTAVLAPMGEIRATDAEVVVALAAGRIEVTSPEAGVLRLYCRAPGAHPRNVVHAVPHRTSRALTFQRPGTIVEDALRLSFEADGGATVSGSAGRHLTIREVVPRATGGMRMTLETNPRAPYFGLGDNTGPMNRRDRVCTMWNSDTTTHTPSRTPLYDSFPVFLSRGETDWYGVFMDNTARSRFDMSATDPTLVEIEVDTGDIDLYVIAGPTPRDVVRRYVALTGTMEMQPKWMLGYQQSRWSYTPDRRVMEVARTFRELHFPCDVIYLDIDYMDRFRSFTFNPTDFHDARRLIDDLHALGFKVIPILNSAVAVDEEFPPYTEARDHDYFVKTPEGKPFEGEMWPGLSSFPDFTIQAAREWWADLHANLFKLGVDGIWNDMNEPTVFKTDTLTFPEDAVHAENRTHLEIHNVYANFMNVATHRAAHKFRPDGRTPIMTRAAYPGIQRYAFRWTGDNHSWWEHMPMAIQQVANLGLCGVPFSGPDVGGFSDDCSPELFLRWVQMGVFFPYLRAHTRQGTRDQEPWSFGDEVLAITRKFVELRYRLIPYLYTLLADAARGGELMLRPMFYEFPDDARSVVADDQFMLGSDFLVAPIMAPSRFWRAVYLPPGEWFSFFSGVLHEGGQVEVAQVPLDHIPVYVRANAIIPMVEPSQYVGEKSTDRIQWHVWAARGKGEGRLYEDDERTPDAPSNPARFCETRVSGRFRAARVHLEFQARQGGHQPGARIFEVIIHGRSRAPRRCNIPGARMADGLIHLEFEDTGAAREIILEW